VIIVRTGYPGTAAVVPDDLDGSNCFSLVIARTGPKLDPHFLACYLNSPAGKYSVARAHFGSAQHNFNVGEMKRLAIIAPPISEQREIVRRAIAHEAVIAAEKRALAKLTRIRTGLMDDLLTGRVRVKVDAEDAA
jgi:type I restriction enzyme S subunit